MSLTSEHFRQIALGMQGAIESAHMGHPDFRAHGKIFATLYPDGHTGMVKLTPDQQAEFMRAHRETFVPASGAWGRQGCTSVLLRSAEENTVGEAMTLAWQNTVKKKAAARARGARRKR